VLWYSRLSCACFDGHLESRQVRGFGEFSSMSKPKASEGEGRAPLIDRALELYIEKTRKENADKSAWIMHPNNFIGVVAICLSLLSVGYGFKKDYFDGIDKDLQSLTSVVSDLTKLDSDMLSSPRPADPQQADSLATFQNNRRFAMLAEADRLIERLGNRVPPIQLAVLGPEYFQVNDYQKAEKYFMQLTEPPASLAMRSEAWRSLAIAYVNQGPAFSDKARAAFSKAASLISDPQDTGSLGIVVTTYEQWAQFELNGGKYSLALQHLQDARKFAVRLPCPKLRPDAISSIDAAIKAVAPMVQDQGQEKTAVTNLELTNATDNGCTAFTAH
jgi:tetratricopeptide (TPR) repeat protein